MSPEKLKIRDSIVYEVFDGPEQDSDNRRSLIRQRCGDDSELYEAVLSEFELEEQIRKRAFLERPEGSACEIAIPKGTQVGEYILGDLIGSGGQGTVFQAQQPRLERNVAIKFLHTRLAAKGRDRFLSEARALSAVHSDHVVHIYNYDEFRGQPYIAMEYVRGVNLGDAIRENRCGDLSKRVDIARQIAEGLEDIHQAGMAHRDVKPSNVLIQTSGKIKLLDFGLAWRQDAHLTHVEQVMGTPAYMAPEQIRRHIEGTDRKESQEYRKVDIYSFGILLYELLTGSLPFTGETLGEVENKILNGVIPLSPLRAAGVPELIVELIRRATSKDPAGRPRTCAEMADLLQDYMGPAEEQHTTGTRRAGVFALAGLALIVLATAAIFAVHRSEKQMPMPATAVNTPPTESVADTRERARDKPPEIPAPAPAGKQESPRSTVVNEPKSASSSATPAAADPRPVLGPDPSLPPPIVTSSPEIRIPVATPPPYPAEEDDWSKLESSPDTDSFQKFLRTYPGGKHANEAKEELARRLWNEIQNSRDPQVLSEFVTRFGGTSAAIKAMNVTRQIEARQKAGNEVLSVLREYAAAFSRMDIEAIAAVRELTPGTRTEFLRSFSTLKRQSMTIQPGKPDFPGPISPEMSGPDFTPAIARVKLQFNVETLAKTGERSNFRGQSTTTELKRTGTAWKITHF